jgi:hypothetical protein
MASLIDIFTDGFSISNPKNLDPVEIDTVYPVVHTDDQLPVNLISPKENGPWIAGGSCLLWFQGRATRYHDIDVFVKNQEQAVELFKRLDRCATQKFQSANAKTYEFYDTNTVRSTSKMWNIQVIIRRHFDSLEHVLSSFDISVCQIGTDGNRWHLGTTTAQDIRTRTLRMRQPYQPDAVKRLTKYWTYGYRPTDDLIANLVSDPETKWEFDNTGDYDNAF